MTPPDHPRSERHTQNRVIALFTEPARPDRNLIEGTGTRANHVTPEVTTEVATEVRLPRTTERPESRPESLELRMLRLIAVGAITEADNRPIETELLRTNLSARALKQGMMQELLTGRTRLV